MHQKTQRLAQTYLPYNPPICSNQTWYVSQFWQPKQHNPTAKVSPHQQLPLVDTTTDPLLGGPITTPRLADKDRAAHLCHISCHDIAGLATPAYHGGKNGVPKLTLSFIHACAGYQSFSLDVADNALPCYGSIQLLHKKVRQSWYNPHTLQSGLSVECTLKQGLTIIPKLSDTTAKDTGAFYE